MKASSEILPYASAASKKHFAFNRRFPRPEGIINGQKTCIVSKLRYGLLPVSANGCGPIAVFNALTASGVKADLCEIILGMENSALHFGGIFGTDPKKLDKYMNENRIPSMKAESYADFVSVMNSVRIGILCYWTGKPYMSSSHYVTLIRTEDGRFSVCNRFSNSRSQSVITAIDKLCTEDRFISGHYMA